MISGKIDPIWKEEHYINLPWFTNDAHEEKFNSTVDTSSYDVGVDMCFENLPEPFLKVRDSFSLVKPVIAVNRLQPGKILPFHRDLFKTYIKRNDISPEDEIRRIIVFLHKPRAGHQLWIEDNICTGEAGSYFGWDQDTVHMAANLGNEMRYILQITGVKL
mgnify:FL=1|tara:strand:- start:1856 stop:2338 length:483 start_codon:yes stop_codon:yes gene_type:complete